MSNVLWNNFGGINTTYVKKFNELTEQQERLEHGRLPKKRIVPHEPDKAELALRAQAGRIEVENGHIVPKGNQHRVKYPFSGATKFKAGKKSKKQKHLDKYLV